MQNHRNDKPPPPRSILTHSALCKFFLPLRAFCRFFGTLYVAVAPYELFFGGARSMSLSLHTSSGGGAAEAAVAVVKNCCECDEWPLQSSSMDDCMTNAKKSSKEPPVVRVPSCTYSHALHIQSQAPSSLRRPSPVLTTK